MKRFILLGVVLLPAQLWASSTDCRVVEMSDRYEAVCNGDPESKSQQLPSEVKVTPVQGKHRPQPGIMNDARAARIKIMNGYIPSSAEPERQLLQQSENLNVK